LLIKNAITTANPIDGRYKRCSKITSYITMKLDVTDKVTKNHIIPKDINLVLRNNQMATTIIEASRTKKNIVGKSIFLVIGQS